MSGFYSVAVNQPWFDCFFDRIDLDAVGLIKVVGWSKNPINPKNPVPRIKLDGQEIPSFQHYRISRPDVEKVEKIATAQAGLVHEYATPETLYGRSFKSLSMEIDTRFKLDFPIDVTFTAPDYRVLFDSPKVYGRGDIYCAGPPNAEIHPEVLAIAKALPGPVLDFGCGSGVLVAELRATGISCTGLEFDNGPSTPRIIPEAEKFVKFYDGRFPSPVATESVRTVFCSEVLEHIPDYHAAVRDMARIATQHLVITVPDSSAIVMGARHRLVPWHLLESTHVNFFNQTSLESVLRPHFRNVEFGRVCGCTLNDTSFHVSLVAFCEK